MNETTVRLISAVIDLIKALVWPTVVIWLILRFRFQVSGLLNRLASFKMAGGEFVFQQSSDKLSVEQKSLEVIDLEPGPDGFLSVITLRTVVNVSKLVGTDETVKGELLIFQTLAQRTWLLATNRQVFVLLDDEETRRKANLIQTTFEGSRALPLRFDVSEGTGTVKFAAEDTWWYYSLHLFPTKNTLAAAVRRLVGQA